MRYIIVDLEATCWAEFRDPGRMEIIEIGAVELATAKGPVAGEFARFVRPVGDPVLSSFCTELTSIRQSDVDAAATFPEVFGEFMEWIGTRAFTFCSWGRYDLQQIARDCTRHGIKMPASLRNHLNLKEEFAKHYRTRPCGMQRALNMLGLPLEGMHHRGIDDARNIAEIAKILLPKI